MKQNKQRYKEVNRPRTELWLYTSIDGKITTMADSNYGKDIDNIKGVTDGMNYILSHDEYDVNCDWVMSTGKSMANVGWNMNRVKKHRTNTKYCIVDNHHLTYDGCVNIAKDMKKVIIATTNNDHPAYAAQMDYDNIVVYHRDNVLNFRKLFNFLWKMRCEEISIQAGGLLNAQLIRAGLVDRIHLFMIPIVVGGYTTPTIADGKILTSLEEVAKIRPLTLERCRRLPENYVELIYVFD